MAILHSLNHCSRSLRYPSRYLTSSTMLVCWECLTFYAMWSPDWPLCWQVGKACHSSGASNYQCNAGQFTAQSCKRAVCELQCCPSCKSWCEVPCLYMGTGRPVMTTVGSSHSAVIQEIYVIFIDQLWTRNSFMLN